MQSELPPLETELPPEALRVLSRARRLTTPCGDGEMVWHAWGEGEPLVLLHGGSGSWTHWVRNVDALAAAGRRVLAADLPGCGDSARPPGNQDADGIVPVVEQGVRLLAGDRPVDFAGFSFGGLVSGLLASAHPQRVKRLVLMGAPALGLRDRRPPVANWRDAPDDAAREAAHRKNLSVWMLHRPESIDAYAVALHAANVRRDRLLKRRLAMTDILAKKLPTLQCPVAAVYGALDGLNVGHIDQLEPRFRLAAGFRELVMVPGAGHWLQYEEADATNRALLRLLP